MKIFADSGCDLPQSFFQENNVTLIPLVVIIDEKEYDDITEMHSTEVYNNIRNGGQPKTSQASPVLFEKHWRELARTGENGLYITFSSELSGTQNTAVMVRDQLLDQHLHLNLTIIDSKCASLGYGLLVKEAVRLRDNGESIATIATKIELMAKHMEHLFTVEDLDYMARGGRVSKASAFIGGLLNIKPLLHVEKGKLIPIEKHRGRKKVLRRIVEIMDERGVDLHNQKIAISHGDDEEIALNLKKLVEEKFSTTDIEIHLIGSVIGAHAGPGTVAVFFLNKNI